MKESALQLTLIVVVLVGAAATWMAIIPSLARGKVLVRYEPRRPVPWGPLHVVFAAIVVLFIPEMVAGAMAQRLHLPFEQWMGDPRVVAAILASRAICVLLLIPALRIATGATMADLGLSLRRIGYDLRLGMLGMLLAIVPVMGTQILLVKLLKFPSEHPIQRLLGEHQEGWVVATMIVAAIVIAPLGEEFLFRGLFQGWLESAERRARRRWRRKWPVPVGFLPMCGSSICFAAVHIGYGPDPIPILILALFLGYLYYRTHRIWPSVAAHFFLNAISMALVLSG